MKITTIPQVYRNVNRWGEILTILSKYGLADWISRFDLPVGEGLSEEPRRRGARPSEPRDADSAGDRRARPDVHQAGADSQHAARPGRHAARRRSCRSCKPSVPADDADVVRETIESELEQAARRAVRRFRHDAAGLGVDRPGPPRAAAQRRRRGGQGAARRHPPPHGSRSRHPGAAWPNWPRSFPSSQPYRPQATVAEFRRVVRREFDFAREARNLQQFARNFRPLRRTCAFRAATPSSRPAAC